MVSTYQQYLYPDFLNPAVDSNKSPLALLAQTCNSIGTVDTPQQQQGNKRKHSFDGNSSINPSSSKSIHTEKSGDGKQGHQSHNESNNHKASKVPKPSPHQADSTTNGDEGQNSTHHHNKEFGKTDAAASGISKTSETTSSGSHFHPPGSNNLEDNKISATSGGSSLGPKTIPSSTLPLLPNQNLNSLLAPHPALSGGALNPLLSTMSTGAFFYPPTMGHASLGCLPVFPSVATATPYYPSAAASLTSALYPKICMDPFCKTCPMGSSMYHHGPTRPCPTGCLQCAASTVHQPFSTASALQPSSADLASWYQAYCSLLFGAPPQPQLGGPFLPSTFGAPTLLAPSVSVSSCLPQMNMSTHPVCWWENGDGRYCLKRFSNAEEFFQHLKTHSTDQQGQKLNVSGAASIAAVPNASSSLSFSGNIALTSQTSPLVSPQNRPGSPKSNNLHLAAAAAYFNPLSSPLLPQYRYHPYSTPPKFGAPTAAPGGEILIPPSSLSFSNMAAAYNAALMSSMQQPTQQRLPGSLPYP